MKFLVTKELHTSPLLASLITGVSLALFLYLTVDILLHAYVIGVDIDAITSTLYGNEEIFVEPILLDSLLLQVHIDFFMSLLSIMVLASIYIRLYSTRLSTKWLVHTVFILGLLSPIMLMVAFFTSVAFVYIWIGSFLMGHILAMFMTLAIIKKVWFK